MTISFRSASSSDGPAISQLIRSLAHYIEDGPVNPDCESYLNTITPAAITDRIVAPGFVYIVAEDENGLCGVAGIKDARHLYHLFVKEELHRRGVARQLWDRIMNTSASLYFTVNSSLFAVPIYTRMGFVASGAQQTRNGVTIQPMVYSKV
ncbi:MAG: GNAT family N-acetyltransferase [Pseudomonadota bacterium]